MTGRRDITFRELEVMRAVSWGRTNGEIATELGVSVHTVRTHVQNAITGLGAHSRAHAIAILFRSGRIR